MSPSQEILNSIEKRLRELEQEIAALQTARSELEAQAAVPKLSEEEWLERRTAELAAQSRAAAA